MWVESGLLVFIQVSDDATSSINIIQRWYIFTNTRHADLNEFNFSRHTHTHKHYIRMNMQYALNTTGKFICSVLQLSKQTHKHIYKPNCTHNCSGRCWMMHNLANPPCIELNAIIISKTRIRDSIIQKRLPHLTQLRQSRFRVDIFSKGFHLTKPC